MSAVIQKLRDRIEAFLASPPGRYIYTADNAAVEREAISELIGQSQEIARLTERCAELEDRALAAEQNQWHAQERCDAYREALEWAAGKPSKMNDSPYCVWCSAMWGMEHEKDCRIGDALAFPAGEQKDKTT